MTFPAPPRLWRQDERETQIIFRYIFLLLNISKKKSTIIYQAESSYVLCTPVTFSTPLLCGTVGHLGCNVGNAFLQKLMTSGITENDWQRLSPDPKL